MRFWSCGWVASYRSFEGTYSLYLQGWVLEFIHNTKYSGGTFFDTSRRNYPTTQSNNPDVMVLNSQSMDTTYHLFLSLRVRAYRFCLLYASYLLCVVENGWFYMKDENQSNLHNIWMSKCMNMLYNIITLKRRAKSEYCSALNLVLRISRIWLSSQKDLNLVVEASWNVMAHAQKPDFVFWRNGRVHLNRRGSQFSRLLAANVCASAVVMLATPCSEVVWRVLAIHSIHQFPIPPPSCVIVCHHISAGVYMCSRTREAALPYTSTIYLCGIYSRLLY